MTSTYNLRQTNRLPTRSKVLWVAALFVALCWNGAEAFAVERDLGILDVPGVTAVGNRVAAGGFTDTYSFEVASDASFGSQLIAISLELYDIDKFTTSLWHDSKELVSGVMEKMEKHGVSYFVSNLSYAPLMPDFQYELRVAGIGSGDKGGVYGGAIKLGSLVSPVPEPEIYAMMLAGMGIMGWAARRKKRRVAI